MSGDTTSRHPPLGPSGDAGRAKATRQERRTDLSLEPGEVLAARWEIHEHLGAGAFGAVYEARDLKFRRRRCAVKLLDPKFVGDEAQLARFQDEVEALRRVRHPHVVAVQEYDHDLDEGWALVSLELVEGGTVADLAVAAAGEAPIRLVQRIFEQSLEALTAAHAEGVVHGDVTPRNMLLAGGKANELLEVENADPKLKLADFGLATLEGGDQRRTRSLAQGTMGYAAPEVWAQGGVVTEKSDVFSAAAVAYELLVGTVPAGRFEDPSEVRDDVPANLEATLLRCLANRQEKRPTASEALEELRATEDHPRAAPSRPTRGRLVETSTPTRPAAPAVDLSGLVEMDESSRWYPSNPHVDQVAEAERLRVPLAVEHEATGVPMVLIPGGESWMGASDGDTAASTSERPRHQVSRDPFYMGITPVTQEQWESVGLEGQSRVEGCSRPVDSVSFEDIQGFLRRPSGYGAESRLRLSTEAEWERAARGGTESAYWWGDGYQAGMANCNEILHGGEDLRESSEVGRFPANPFGLYDVLGNVWEWVEDVWHYNYVGTPANGSAWLRGERTSLRVVRGGAWNSSPRSLRVSHRYMVDSDLRNVNFGFRCMRTVLSP